MGCPSRTMLSENVCAWPCLLRQVGTVLGSPYDYVVARLAYANPGSRQIIIPWFIVGIGPEEEWFVFTLLENGASSRNIRADQRQHFSWMCGMQQFIDWKHFWGILW